MAKRLALVEEEYLKRLKNNSQTSDRKTEKIEEAVEEIHVYGAPLNAKDNMQILIDLLPPRLRVKAKLLLHYVKNVNLDSQGRVIYSGGETGSYLIDLIK